MLANPMTEVVVDMSGAAVVESMAGKDLNKSGKIVNLVICGNSQYYDYSFIEDKLDEWVGNFEYPDLIIIGGASGVDYLAERWSDNHNIPCAIFSEAWNVPRRGREDDGRPEAAPDLVNQMLERATHVIAFPGPKSKWTHIMVESANSRGIDTTVIPVE